MKATSYLVGLFNNELAKESCLNVVLILDRLVLLNSPLYVFKFC